MKNIPKEIIEEIEFIFRDKEFQKFFSYLYSRWQDEKEFEDIEDYKKAVQTRVPESWTVLSMTKQPFAFTFSLENAPGSVFRFRMNSRSMAFDHIK
jgi:hypothetical protein